MDKQKIQDELDTVNELIMNFDSMIPWLKKQDSPFMKNFVRRFERDREIAEAYFEGLTYTSNAINIDFVTGEEQ